MSIYREKLEKYLKEQSAPDGNVEAGSILAFLGKCYLEDNPVDNEKRGIKLIPLKRISLP